MKILIIQNKYIGDILLSSLIAIQLKKYFPNAEIHFFCYEPAKSLLVDNPAIDKIIAVDANKLKKISVLLSYIKKIRNEKYNIIIDPYAKLQSRLIVLFSKSKLRISYQKKFFKYFYSHTIPFKKEAVYYSCAAIENRLNLLKPLIPQTDQLDEKISLYLNENELLRMRSLMREKGISFNKPIIIIELFGSRLEKTYPIDKMQTIVFYLLRNYDADFIFNYLPSKQQEIAIFKEKLPEELKGKVYFDILGQNIYEFACIMSNSSLLIGNEGGAINIAKILDKPTFSIFSPHVYRKDWNLYGNLPKHQSFHLEDVHPEIYQEITHRQLRKSAVFYYHLMASSVIIEKIDKFLEIFYKKNNTNNEID